MTMNVAGYDLPILNQHALAVSPAVSRSPTFCEFRDSHVSANAGESVETLKKSGSGEKTVYRKQWGMYLAH
jgi:hypothetical protein